MKEFKLTKNAKEYIKYLQDAGITSPEDAQTGKEIADGMGKEKPNGVAASLRGPRNAGLIDIVEAKPTKYFLTDAGVEVDTTVEDEEA